MNTVFPTKSNLLKTKKSLSLASLGYDLLERKRNVMMREMLGMMDRVKEVQGMIGRTYEDAYAALARANMSCGQQTVMRAARSTPVRDDINVRYRSIMGIEIPEVTIPEELPAPSYGIFDTTAALDEAYVRFNEVARLVCAMAEIECGVYRLAAAIKQTRKRANALKNIVIPELSETVRYIEDYLEEKEREGFTTQKVVKGRKNEDTL